VANKLTLYEITELMFVFVRELESLIFQHQMIIVFLKALLVLPHHLTTFWQNRLADVSEHSSYSVTFTL
jgi:hypothetical protein